MLVQVLHCVRHGQSTFNAASNTMPSFADPQIFDAELTALGKRQVLQPAWPDHACPSSIDFGH